MRKLFKAMFLIMVIAVVIGWNFNQSKKEKQMSELVLANIEALAAEDHAGDVANKYCPIWNVTYTESWSGTTVSCTTGGQYKCAKGTCPHGA